MAAEPASIVIGAEQDFYHTAARKSRILSWILSTDHKRIGILYLVKLLLVVHGLINR